MESLEIVNTAINKKEDILVATDFFFSTITLNMAENFQTCSRHICDI